MLHFLRIAMESRWIQVSRSHEIITLLSVLTISLPFYMTILKKFHSGANSRFTFNKLMSIDGWTYGLKYLPKDI